MAHKSLNNKIVVGFIYLTTVPRTGKVFNHIAKELRSSVIVNTF